MYRVACDIAYDGTDYVGFQYQPKGRTIQSVIEDALTDIHKGRMTRIYPSGRTDTGVHARQQVIHFDTDLRIADYGWRQAITNRLPSDVAVTGVRHVDHDFHARFSVNRKEYRYTILRRTIPDVFRDRFTHHYPYDLDVSRMQTAANKLIGTHDFTSFCATHTSVTSKVRTLDVLDVFEQGDELVIRCIGKGFLRQMVRIMAGVLLDVGQGRKAVSDIDDILAAKNRRAAGKTMPGCGLTLWTVSYEE